MSATDWGTCPRCHKEAHEAKAKQRADTIASYGKVPVDEYLVLRAESEKDVVIEETLREDYGTGVKMDGVFYVHYRCECKCGFSFEYEYEQATEPPAKGKAKR